MKILKLTLITALIFVFTSCVSISKMYDSGSAQSDEFYGRTTFSTVFDLMIVPVEINGKSYNFLFDTGAPMVISDDLQTALELEAVRTGRVTDSQGESKSLDYVWLEKLSIGGIEFKKLGALVADLDFAPELGCMKIDGIIGANLMRLAKWKIKYSDNQMFFASDREALKITEGDGLILPFDVKRTYTPVVSLAVNGDTLQGVTFDTGFGGYLTLGGVLDTSKGNNTVVFGYGNTGLYGSSIDTAVFSEIDLQVAGFDQTGFTKFELGNTKKLIGIDFMKQFEMVLDWELNQVELYPQKLKMQKMASFGFKPKWNDNKLVVGSVDINSEAFKAGLKMGDRIVKINQWNFNDPTLNNYCGLLIYLHENQVEVIDIELSDGRQFRFSKQLVYAN